MATSTIAKYLEITQASRWSSSQTVIVNVDKFKDGGNGGYAFLVIARSWAAVAAASSVYLVSGIQNGLYESCAQIVKETNGPTVTMKSDASYASARVRIQFANTYGGHYAIVPLYNILS